MPSTFSSISFYALLIGMLFFAVILILLILIQKGRGGGLSGAFGGSGGSTAFGAKTGDVLTWATSVVFGLFLVFCVAMDLFVDSQWKTVTPPTSTAAAQANAPIVPPIAAEDTTPAPVASPTSTPVVAGPFPATGPSTSMPAMPGLPANVQSTVQGGMTPPTSAPSIDQLVKKATTQVDKAIHTAGKP